MANLKEVRDRIASVQNTQQITKAMKMVAASKLRKAQMAVTQMGPYTNKLNEMLRNILSNLGGDVNSSFGVERPVVAACLVVVTSDRGLCGAFNANIIKAAVTKIEKDYSAVRENGHLSILCIGKKGYEFFRKNYSDCKVHGDFVDLFHDLSFENVSKVATKLMTAFEKGDYDNLAVAYGRFKNPAVQIPEVEQFLPVAKIEAEGEAEAKGMLADYTFEPNKDELLEQLIPDIIKAQFYKYVLDTSASEHGARMTAMDAATENAGELIKDLRLAYNKARQEAITNQILEIVGGAAALENG